MRGTVSSRFARPFSGPFVGTLMKLDFARLFKVMSLFESSSDGEALAALRQATTILKSADLRWCEFSELFKSSNDEDQVADKIDEDDARHLVALMDEILGADIPEARRNFVQGVKQSYVKHGTLTQKQKLFVRRTYAWTFPKGAKTHA